MFHFCIMGGHEGELNPDHTVCITIFGGCELKRPTLARQIMEMRDRAQSGLPKRTHFFVTICGATELKAPTLAEEYLAMQEAIKSGVLTLEAWDDSIARLASHSGFRCGSFTLMGGFGSDELPTEEQEVDGLAINRHLGHISEQAGTVLELGVGQGGAQRAAILRQALASTLRLSA